MIIPVLSFTRNNSECSVTYHKELNINLNQKGKLIDETFIKHGDGDIFLHTQVNYLSLDQIKLITAPNRISNERMIRGHHEHR